MLPERIIEHRRIRDTETTPNGLDYYTGKGSLYPNDGTYLDFNSLYKYRFLDMANWISHELNTENDQILDVGGAIGSLGYHMKSVNTKLNVIHTDLSLSALKYSKDKYDHTPIAMSANRLSFSDNTFGGVVFADVLEHLQPNIAVESLVEAHRILRPEGKIFINIPNRFTWSSRAWKEPSHIWIPSIFDMAKILKTLDFSDIKYTTRGFPWVSNLRPIFKRDLHFPLWGKSIFISAKKA